MRTPSCLTDCRLSLRRLRTTPAKNPRTECCCQPVTFIRASMLAPPGALSISIALDCLVPDLTRCGSAVLGGLEALRRFADFAADAVIQAFLAVLAIGISSVRAAHPAAPPKPRGGHLAGGAGFLSAFRAPKLRTVPLCLQANASHFWIMMLLIQRCLEHLMIWRTGPPRPARRPSCAALPSRENQ